MQTMIAESALSLLAVPSATPDSTPCLSIKRTDISSAQQITALFPLTASTLSPTCHSTASSKMLKTTPLFNLDSLHYTPAFMLEQDQHRLHRNPQNLKLFRKLHEGKIQQCLLAQATPLEEDIMVPRPTANLFCHVCKAHYDDYLTHTTSPSHTTKVEQNKFWTDITKLCSKFGPKTTPKKTPRRKPIKKMEAECKRNKGKPVDGVPHGDSATSIEIRP